MIKMLMFDLKKSETQFLKGFDTSDFEITYYKESLDKNTKLTVKECDETVILSTFVTSDITKEVLDKFKNLRIIISRSVCYNHIDITECRKRNIAVINSTGYATSAVAQFVTGLIFALTRNIVKASENIKKSRLLSEKFEGVNIENLSVGVIGTGMTGSAVCEICHRLGMKIYANDFTVNKDIASFTEYVSFNDLIRLSDIITLHIPYSKECYHMFSDKQFEIMKETGYIINVSRGDFIDLTALYKAIKEGKIKGGALDILTEEKDIFDKNLTRQELEEILIKQKLTDMPDIIITPAIAYDTKESSENILKSNFHDIKDYFIGRKTNRVV